MRMKSLIAALIALAMISVPCAAVVGAQDVYAADDEDKGIAVGDAWGFSASAESLDDLNELFDSLMAIFEEDEENNENNENGDDDDTPMDIFDLFFDDEDLGEDDKAILDDIMDMLNLKLDFNIVLAGIAEVTEADKNGYALSIDAGISAEVSFEINIKDLEKLYEDIDEKIPGYKGAEVDETKYNKDFWDDIRDELGYMPDLLGTGELFVKLNLSFALILSGIAKFDSESELTHVNLSIDVAGDITFESNMDLVEIVNNMRHAEESPLIRYLDDGDKEVYSITVGFSADHAAYISDDAVRTSTISGFAIGVEAPEAFLLMMKYALGIPGEVYKRGTNLQFSMMGVMSSYDSDDYEFGGEFDDMIPDLGFFDSDIFDFDFSDMEIDRESKLFLKDEDKDEVRNDFNKVKNVFNGLASKLPSSNVTFYGLEQIDEDEDVWELYAVRETEVPYNGRITDFPVLENVTYGKGEDAVEYKHVGWGYKEDWDYGGEEDVISWNSAWKVKGDLDLYPIFAVIYKSLDEAFDNIEDDGLQFRYVSTKIGDLEDVDYDFDYEGTLYVDVYDGDKLSYAWTVNGADDGKITNFKIETLKEGKLYDKVDEKVEGNFLYLDFKSSGKTPPGTTVSYNVDGVFDNGTELEVFFVIEEDGEVRLDTVGYAVVAGNMVTFDVPHCSGYLLNVIPMPSDGDTGYLLYLGVAIVAILLIAGIAYVLYSRKK